MPDRPSRPRAPESPDDDKPPLIPQEHGGAIYAGGVRANRGGPGRQRDAIRERLARVVDDQGVDFIHQVMSGEVPVTMQGRCAKCGAINDGPSATELRGIAASVDHRLQAFDKAAKYGLGTQTEVVTPDDLKAAATRIVDVVVTVLLDEEHWPREKVEAVAARIVRAAAGEKSTGDEGR